MELNPIVIIAVLVALYALTVILMRNRHTKEMPKDQSFAENPMVYGQPDVPFTMTGETTEEEKLIRELYDEPVALPRNQQTPASEKPAFQPIIVIDDDFPPITPRIEPPSILRPIMTVEAMDQFAEQFQRRRPRTIFSKVLGKEIPYTVVERCDNGSFMLDTERGFIRKKAKFVV